jgi:SAM-dependent methyltransferase
MSDIELEVRAKDHPFVKAYPSFYDRTVEEIQDLMNSTRAHYDYYVRAVIIRMYGFSLPCKGASWALKKHFGSSKSVIDAGCGSGYWGSLIQYMLPETKVYCVDSYETRFNFVAECLKPLQDLPGHIKPIQIYRDDAVKFLERNPEADLFMSWPDYESSFAEDLAKLLRPGGKLAYIGEDRGGCTANEVFFDVLDKDFEEPELVRIPQFMAIHDYLTIYQKKG